MAFSSFSLKVSFSFWAKTSGVGVLSLAMVVFTSFLVVDAFFSLGPQLRQKINSKLVQKDRFLRLMKFAHFVEQLVKIKKLPLPGQAAHYIMEPAIRKEFRAKGVFDATKAKKAAVMALFYPKADAVHLLLILRKEYQGVHSKQIGFPGGKVEKEDIDLLYTAKRETFEEVGVAQEDIITIKKLTAVYIPPSNFLVQPYIGTFNGKTPFLMDPVEVEALVEVSLEDFMDDANVQPQQLSTSYAKNITVPAFKLNGYVVWGATAMMLSEIKELLRPLF